MKQSIPLNHRRMQHTCRSNIMDNQTNHSMLLLDVWIMHWWLNGLATYHLQIKEPSVSDVLPAAHYCQSCHYSLRLLRTLRKQQIKQNKFWTIKTKLSTNRMTSHLRTSCGTRWLSGVAEQLGGGWPSRGQTCCTQGRVCFSDDAPRRADDTHRKRTISVWQQHIEPP